MAAATNPLTYNGYVTQIALMSAYQTQTVSGVVQGVDPNFTAVIPSMLNYAELRIQRDVALLPLLTSRSYTLTQDVNTFSIPVEDFVTLETVSVNVSGQLKPLLPVSKEYLQAVWPSSSTPAPPYCFAMIGGDAATAGNTSNNIMFGPPPDSAYPLSVFGTVRMPSLNQQAIDPQAGTATTFISTWLPDLLVQASMIYVSEYQRNFGRASDDPTMAMTYEAAYQGLLSGATAEEARKRFAAGAWSSQPPAPTATPSR